MNYLKFSIFQQIKTKMRLINIINGYLRLEFCDTRCNYNIDYIQRFIFNWHNPSKNSIYQYIV